MTTPAIKQIIIRMSEDKKHILRIQAAKKDMSINQYLNWLIEQNINDSAEPSQAPSYTTAHVPLT